MGVSRTRTNRSNDCTANNWGKCEDGDHQVGCGPQETYRNCGDIAVKHDLGVRGVTDVKNNGVDGKRVHW